MRILLLSQFFEPEPTLKGLQFAKALQGYGHSVEVLTGFPNYPGGRVYDGYRVRLWQRAEMDGVPVVRTALYPSHDRSSLRRVANYASFAFSASTVGAALTGRPDVVYAYHPPATVGLPAVLCKWCKGAKLVYDIQDLWPDTVGVTGMVGGSLPLRAIGAWCRFVYRTADRLVVLSPGFRERLVQRGVPRKKVELIYNWSNEGAVQRCERDAALATSLGFEGKLNVVFAGTMGAAQDIGTVLAAARLLGDSHPGVQFVFVGGGTEAASMKAEAERSELKNVRFLPHRPVGQMGPLFALADVLLVHLKDDPLFRITIPSKTQVYMAMGKPILMGVAGDAADLVARAGAGLLCQPGSAAALAEGVRRFVEMGADGRAAMGAAGYEFYQRELSMAAGVRRFVDVFERVHQGGSQLTRRGEGQA
jgi:glycosyltransferase involved in cell wall biosynthesis